MKKIRLRSGAVVALALGAWLFPSAAMADALAGRVDKSIGTVRATRGGSAFPLRKGDSVRVGDVVTTGANGAVKIVLFGDDSIVLAENSRIVVEKYKRALKEPGASVLSNIHGKVRFFVKPRENKASHRLETSSSVFGIRGTAGLIAAGPDGATRLYVSEGVVEAAPLRGNTAPVAVTAGQRLAAGADGLPVAASAAFAEQELRSEMASFGELSGEADSAARPPAFQLPEQSVPGAQEGEVPEWTPEQDDRLRPEPAPSNPIDETETRGRRETNEARLRLRQTRAVGTFAKKDSDAAGKVTILLPELDR